MHSNKYIASEIASQLPGQYEPLLLTFRVNESDADNEFVVIGDDYGTNLCIHCASGCIYSIHPANEYPTRFVNSSVQQLAQSIAAHVDYGRRIQQSQNEHRQLAGVNEFRLRLVTIDPHAMSNPENW